ncbi:MAG: MFS transporter, partial [Anaerolineales bacterium]|nr:MFS transporter [Anaerolineales bacterium]
GAILGPLLVSAVLYLRGDYRAGFALLLIPALLALGVLLAARVIYPRPQDLEATTPELRTRGFPRVFWLYLSAVALVAAGYADFPLIAYHFEKTNLLAPALIPVFYAVAMGVDALAALLFGRLFDRIGLTTLVIVSILSAFFAPLVFLGNESAALVGVALWGVGLGAQESILRAAVAGMVPADRRGSAYGLFNTGFGLAWFAGSALMGGLYDVSLPALVAFAVAAQLSAAPLFYLLGKGRSRIA